MSAVKLFRAVLGRAGKAQAVQSGSVHGEVRAGHGRGPAPGQGALTDQQRVDARFPRRDGGPKRGPAAADHQDIRGKLFRFH